MVRQSSVICLIPWRWTQRKAVLCFLTVANILTRCTGGQCLKNGPDMPQGTARRATLCLTDRSINSNLDQIKNKTRCKKTALSKTRISRTTRPEEPEPGDNPMTHPLFESTKPPSTPPPMPSAAGYWTPFVEMPSPRVYGQLPTKRWQGCSGGLFQQDSNSISPAAAAPPAPRSALRCRRTCALPGVRCRGVDHRGRGGDMPERQKAGARVAAASAWRSSRPQQAQLRDRPRSHAHHRPGAG